MGLGLELEDSYEVGNTSFVRVEFLFLRKLRKNTSIYLHPAYEIKAKQSKQMGKRGQMYTLIKL